MIGLSLAGHRLEPRAPASEMIQVAGQIGGIQAQVMSAAEMSLGVTVKERMGLTREAERLGRFLGASVQVG